MHKSISLNWNECLFFHSYSLSLFYPNNHNPSSHSKSHTDSSPVRQWETSKSYPTTDIQPTIHYHTIHLPTNQVRVEVTIFQQLLMYSLSRNHTIVNHEDDIHNSAQTMCHHSRMSLSTPSTPSRTYPNSRCPTHSSPRPEGGSRDCDNANRCF